MKPIRNPRLWLSLMAMFVLAFPATARADSGGSNAGEAFNIEVVGHNDLGMRGFNADVWVHKGLPTLDNGVLAIGRMAPRIASALLAPIPVLSLLTRVIP